MTAIGETNLVPVSPAGRLNDIIDRYWHTHGRPPDRVLASYGFRFEMAEHIMRTEPWNLYAPGAPQPMSADFYFNGVPVSCVLRTPHSTLLILG